MKKYGLIGTTLTHSFSVKYFNDKFQKENLTECQYQNYSLASIGEFKGLFERESLLGVNVTIPYKESIIPYLDRLSKEAKDIGAVNCVKLEGGELVGYNTDSFGFKNSLQPLLKDKTLKALILGSGGASKSVRHALNELGIEYQIVSRKGSFSYHNLDDSIMQDHHLIINTTPLGAYPKTIESPTIPYNSTGEKHLFFDLVYNPEVSTFLRRGLKQKSSIKNGLEMLYLQAEKSWEIWNS